VNRSSREALDHLALFRADHHRVGVVHHQRGDRRVQAQLPGQHPPKQELVDDPGPGPGQLGVEQSGPVHRERPQRQLQQPAADPAPRADQRGQAGDRTHCLPAPGLTFDGHPDPDHRRLGGGVLQGQGADVRGRDPGLLRSPFRGVTPDPFGQLVVADRVVTDVALIGEPFADNDIHHRQRERAVGAGPDRDIPVRVRGGLVPDRVDHDDLGAAALRLGHERPQVQVRRDHVAGPDHDVAGVHQALRIHPRGRADRHGVCRAGTRVAVGALGDRGPELVEERVTHVQAVEDPFGTQVADRHDRLRAVLGDRRPEPAGDLVQRLVPGNPAEPATALRAGAAQRVQHPVGAVDLVDVVVHLHAQPAAGERMPRIPPHLHRAALAHRDQHGAGVRAIVRARPANGCRGLLIDGGSHERSLRPAVPNLTTQYRRLTAVRQCRSWRPRGGHRPRPRDEHEPPIRAAAEPLVWFTGGAPERLIWAPPATGLAGTSPAPSRRSEIVRANNNMPSLSH
jgi:hypothetical protein